MLCAVCSGRGVLRFELNATLNTQLSTLNLELAFAICVSGKFEKLEFGFSESSKPNLEHICRFQLGLETNTPQVLVGKYVIDSTTS